MSFNRHIRKAIAAIAVAMLAVPLMVTPVSSATATTTAPTELRPGESVTSPDGRYKLVHQHDGNVVLYGSEGSVWHTKTYGHDTSKLVFQGDGNFVLYGDGRALWHTATHGKGQALAVQDDGNLVVYDSSKAVWAIKGMAPPPSSRNVRQSTSDGCGGWRHTVSHHFGWEVSRACRVLMCESQGNPSAKNPRSTASGLFQFLDGTWRSTTGTPAPARAYSPDVQVRAAKTLRDSQGWSPWVCR